MYNTIVTVFKSSPFIFTLIYFSQMLEREELGGGERNTVEGSRVYFLTGFAHGFFRVPLKRP